MTSEHPTWSRVDLAAILAGDIEPARPTLLPRTDGVCLLYPGLVHSFHGESESGKSFVIQAESARLIQAGRPVLYVDFESDAQAVVSRLLLLGCTPDQIAAHLDYRRPETRPDVDLEGWGDMMSREYDLAVIDGVTDALCLFGRESNGNDDIAAWHRLFPRQLARATGAAVALIDHVTKSSDGRGRFAIGGQAKLASLDGAAYTVDVVDPLGAGLKGRLRLRVAKDRPGQVRQHGGKAGSDRTQHVADFVLDATGDRLTATMYPATDGPDPEERKIAYQAVVAVRVVTETPGMSLTKVRDAIRAEGCQIRNGDVAGVVEYAVQKGHMRTEQNGQTTRLYPTRPNPSQPVPGRVTQPVPPSPPLGGDGGRDRSWDETSPRSPGPVGAHPVVKVIDVATAWSDLFYERWPNKRCRNGSERTHGEEALLEALNAGLTVAGIDARLTADLPTLTAKDSTAAWLDALLDDDRTVPYEMED